MVKKRVPSGRHWWGSVALRDALSQTEPPITDPNPKNFEGGFEDRPLTKEEVARVVERWSRRSGITI